jgi:hypothetical protein
LVAEIPAESHAVVHAPLDAATQVGDEFSRRWTEPGGAADAGVRQVGACVAKADAEDRTEPTLDR